MTAPAAYIATVTPFALDSQPVRAVRLSARQHAALTGLRIDIPIDGTSPLRPCVQAEAVIADAVAALLRPHAASAVLWRRDRDLGDVSVWHDGAFVPIASVELAPAQVGSVAA